MSKPRFRVITPLLAVLILACLTACTPEAGRESGTRGKTTIEFWHYLAGPQAQPVDELVSKFEKAHPDVKVRAVFQGNVGQLKQKLDGSFASGTKTNPAVSLAYESWVDDFLARGYIDPVQNHLDGPEGLSQEEQQDIVKAFREGNTWDGKLVTLPFNKSIYLLYLNMDMLRQAGFTTAPLSQDQLQDAARKMTTHQGSRTTTYGWGIMPRGEAFSTLFVSRGGTFLDESGAPQLNSPKALETMQMLKQLQFPQKHLYVNPDYMSAPFANKMIGMFIYSSASLPYVKKGVADKFDYEAAPVPGIEGVEARYLMQGTNIAMYANKSPAERAAAWKLVRFLTLPENAAYFAVRSGYMPYRYSVLEQAEFVNYMKNNPDYAMAANMVLSDRGIQEPKSRAWEGIRTEIDNAVDVLLSRPDSDPKALLDDLQAKAAAKLKPNS